MATKKNEALAGKEKDKQKPAKQPAAKLGKKRLGKVKVPGFIRSFVGYFVGAWQEIRQVRWPSRKATWKSTLAVLIFTAFWMAIILAVDLVFQKLLNNLLT